MTKPFNSDSTFGGRYAVTMFSFMNEILSAKKTTNEIMTDYLESGISKIVCEKAGEPISELWFEHAKRSIQMFNEAGVVIEYYET